MAHRVVVQRLSQLAVRRSSSSSRLQHISIASRHVRWIQTTPVWRSEETTATKDTAVVADKEDTAADKQENVPQDTVVDDDPCPPWQNPLHHNNPDYQKMFPEDFEGEEMPIQPLPPMAKPGSDVQAPPHIHDLADEILALNMLEMKELVDRIADHFGFDVNSVVMGLGGGGGAVDDDTSDSSSQEEIKEEVKTVFDLKAGGI